MTSNPNTVLGVLMQNDNDPVNINWMDGYGNHADLEVVVPESHCDELNVEPFAVVQEYSTSEEIRMLVVARKKGLAKFRALCSVENGGYGGREFNLPVYTDDPDMPVITLRTGAWSSNSTCINQSIVDPFKHVLEVTALQDVGNYQRCKVSGYAMEIPVLVLAVALWNERYATGMGGEAALVYDTHKKEWLLLWVEYTTKDRGVLLRKPGWDRPLGEVSLDEYEGWGNDRFSSCASMLFGYALFTGMLDMEDLYDDV